MKLIKVLKLKDKYEIKALVSYKFLNIHFLSIEKSFTKKEGYDCWYSTKNNKKVSEARKLKLDKWLKTHQKFIEKI
ncbi:hypothetical protein [Christiangramia forsetii]|uniref:Uncharacterized protein n=2 Tax=Christiangramia forsetii TaxID=411153 RepID=A0M215_CHRFK|nr:hypothetical protein [Christiangramia forsetii]GGG44794.1 hypothetical protein GCM10011532_30990 [Christiangramia forsetii]CAL66660.1 hypothetical protein GFO_1689 [Christiangramia forsetii KT0803]